MTIAIRLRGCVVAIHLFGMLPSLCRDFLDEFLLVGEVAAKLLFIEFRKVTMRYAWMLMVVFLIGCHASPKQRVVVTTKVDPFYIENPEEAKASCSVTYECRW